MVCEESQSETAPSPELLKIASPDSSPSSAESNFRELDDAFLQTQTRIWLGEVLQIRLDEQLIISELLADGELLFLVSKVVWKLLLAKHMELRHIKAYKSQPFASKRNSGRYRPYSNVDSFLKICKILGLTGVDLFSPSDVVERRNTRKVCICIRSFSKKLRSKNIDVPDFDIVTCVVAMPKNLVGCIRRSIERSHSSPADSSSYYLQKHAGQQSMQVYYSVTDSIRDWETYSDQSNDAEIKHPAHQFDDLHSDELYDYASEINYNVPSPMVECDFMSEDLDQLDSQNQQRHEISDDEFQLLCSRESLQFHCSENVEHDCKLNWSSSPYCGALHIDFSGVTSCLDTRVQESRIMDFDYFENDSLRDNVSVIGTPMNDKMLVTRDVSSHAKDRRDHDLLNEENITANVHKSASSHGSSSTPQSIESGRCFKIDENMEALHVAGMSCLSREAEALNLGDQFDAEDDFQDIESFQLHNEENDRLDEIKEEYGSQDLTKYKEMAFGITSNARYSYSVKELEATEHSLYSPDCLFCKTDSPNRAASHSNDITSTLPRKFLAYEDKKSQVDLTSLDDTSCKQSQELLSCQSYSLPELCKWDQKGKCAMTSSGAIDNNSSSGFLEDGPHEETTPCKQKTSEVLLPCVPNEEDAVNAAVTKLGTDCKELKNDFQALASNAPSGDDSESCPTIRDDANDFCGKGVTTTQDSEDQGQRVRDMITNDAAVPVNCDEDVSHTGSCITNQSSKLECNDGHQACQYNRGPVYHSEHTLEVRVQEEINPEDESVHSFENLVETEEGVVEIPKAKPQKKLLLKSVLGGAAAVGLLFMFLHLRRNGEEKDTKPEPSKAFSHKGKEKIQKHSPQKVKRRSTTTEGVYSAEKLKLK